MLKTYLYIPDHLEEKILQVARTQKKSKAEVMRQALESGLKKFKRQGNAGVEVLLKLAELGEKYHIRGPKDASVNHDYYLWGLPKKNPKIKP